MTFNRFFRQLAMVVAGGAFVISTASAQSKPVRLAWTPSADVPQIPVALQAGLWKAAGIEVAITTFPSGREALEALIGGQVDAAAIAEFPAVTAGLRGQNIGVVADLSRYSANRIVTTSETPTLQSLAGKKIGVTIGTNAQFQLETALSGAGVTATLVNAAPSDLMPTLVRKDINAAAVFPAFVPRAKEMLGAQYRDIPTPAYVTHFLLVGAEAFLRDRKPDAANLLKGFVAADVALSKDPAMAQSAVVKATNGALQLQAVAGNWKDYDFRTVLNDDAIELMNAEAKWILSKGLVKSTMPPSEAVKSVIKPELLRQVDSTRVTVK